MARAARNRPAPACSIFRWDLDKTYLKSEFDSMRDLVKIPFEKPQDKVEAPGVAALIRQLRAVGATAGREVRIYFLSASPPQIGRAIKEKLALDGIEYDGIVFKNQLHHLVRGKFRNLREHIGYKLGELLKSHLTAPRHAREFLFGDDWESDPLIYSLYADVLAGRVDEAEVRDVLHAVPVDPKQVDAIVALQHDIEPMDVVVRIYINLERRTPPANFRAYGPRLVPAFNYFQTAACLFGDGELTLPAVARVAESLIERSGYTRERLANSLADIIRRGHVSEPTAIALRQYLIAQELLPQARAGRRRGRSLWQTLARWMRGHDTVGSAPAPQLDYRRLAAELRASE
jgi:Phosphatidate phosphatase APP1, catalytic domain